MTIKLHGVDMSPVFRATLLTVEALGLEVEIKEVNPALNEQFKQEFLQINPLHTIPTIQDGDFILWDSHAINSYLVEKYGKDDSLYPKDVKKRAVVNQRLYFDCGLLFTRLAAIIFSLTKGAKSVRKDLADSVVDAYTQLEALLQNTTYVAADHVTIADFSIVTTLTTAIIFVPLASNRFPKIHDWLTKMESLPYYASTNQVGLEKLAAGAKTMLS